MSGIEEADKALQSFIDEYDLCATCAWWTPEPIGGICDAPEYPIDHLLIDTSTCEQHVFKNNKLNRQLGVLVDKYYNAWFIVHGFLYCETPKGIL